MDGLPLSSPSPAPWALRVQEWQPGAFARAARVTQSPDLAEWKWKRLHFIAIKLIAAVNVENARDD